MVLPLIAGLALKGIASNALGSVLGGENKQQQNPVSIFSQGLNGADNNQQQQDGVSSLLNTLLNPLSLLGGGQEDEQNQQQLPGMDDPFKGKKPPMPPKMNFLA